MAPPGYAVQGSQLVDLKSNFVKINQIYDQLQAVVVSDTALPPSAWPRGRFLAGSRL